MPNRHRKRHHSNDLGGPPGKTCAYCHYHHIYITPRQMRQRECLKKQCRRLEKVDHPYWEHREKTKEYRIARKEAMRAELAKYGK